MKRNEQRILFCATVDYHFKAFHLPILKWFKDQGWQVHVVANGELELPYVDKKFNIPIQRSPFRSQNIVAYNQLNEIMKAGHYQIIECHTPMGGVLGRLAGRQTRKYGTKVIYTAHGFHFCKGAPLVNWLLYYPIEKLLAHYTDCLITINNEDYQLAKKHRFYSNNIKHVHGVGVNPEQMRPVNKLQKNVLRAQYGYEPDEVLLFYAAEFNKNKNQKLLIQSLALIKDQVRNVKLLLAGDGPTFEEDRELAERLEVTEMVHFLGLRDDIEQLLKMCDIEVASSYREGLPVNVMEAMSCGLPIIATNNRGHQELVVNNVNGWLTKPGDIEEFATRMKALINNKQLRKKFGKTNRRKIYNTYSIDKVLEEKIQIYQMYMKETEELKWVVH